MNPFALLFHLGTVLTTFHDGEKLWLDLTSGENVGADLVKTLDDIVQLVLSGVVPLPPGMNSGQAQSILDSLKKLI